MDSALNIRLSLRCCTLNAAGTIAFIGVCADGIDERDGLNCAFTRKTD